MNAIRQYGIVHENKLVLHLPSELNEQQVEIIVLPIENQELPKQKKGVDIESIRKKISVKLTEEEINGQLKSIREEWEKPIF